MSLVRRMKENEIHSVSSKLLTGSIWWRFKINSYSPLFPDCRPDVLPHRLPAAHPGRQQLRAGRADSAGASPDAASLFGGRGRQPSPSSLPAAGARQGGLSGRATHPADGSDFLRYPEPSRVGRGAGGIFSGCE